MNIDGGFMDVESRLVSHHRSNSAAVHLCYERFANRRRQPMVDQLQDHVWRSFEIRLVL